MQVDFLVFYNFCIEHFPIGALVLEIFVLKVVKLYICTHRSSAQATMFLQHRQWDYLIYSALSTPQVPKTLLHWLVKLYSMYVPTSRVLERRCLGSNYTEALERAAGDQAMSNAGSNGRLWFDLAPNGRVQCQKSFLLVFSRLWPHFRPF